MKMRVPYSNHCVCLSAKFCGRSYAQGIYLVLQFGMQKSAIQQICVKIHYFSVLKYESSQNKLTKHLHFMADTHGFSVKSNMLDCSCIGHSVSCFSHNRPMTKGIVL